MPQSMRLWILTQWFDPEPSLKGLLFARELIKRGFEVEVITGFPNYPGGRLYPGYRMKWVQRESIYGVKITRVPLYPSHDRSLIRRAMSYCSFAATSLFFCLFIAKRADVIYAYHPPLTVGIVASIVRLLRNIPVVYDIQDLWPDTLRATGMLSNRHILRVVHTLCTWVYRRVDRIVVQSPGFKKILLMRGVPKAKLTVVYNWTDEASLAKPTGAAPAALVDRKCFSILFAGNMGAAQSLGTILRAAALLQNDGSRVCWFMLGGGIDAERLKAEAVRLQLKNVVFLPTVPVTQVGMYLQAADALLVHLRKDPLFEVTIPSKTQAYMAVGKPLLMAVDGDAADLVRKSGCGLVVESENAQALAKAADVLASTGNDTLKVMGQRAQQFYRQHLSLNVGVAQFVAVFLQLAESGDRSDPHSLTHFRSSFKRY